MFDSLTCMHLQQQFQIAVDQGETHSRTLVYFYVFPSVRPCCLSIGIVNFPAFMRLLSATTLYHVVLLLHTAPTYHCRI
jgi:hypothetical protein